MEVFYDIDLFLASWLPVECKCSILLCVPFYPPPFTLIRTRQSAVIREAPADTSQTFGNTSRRVWGIPEKNLRICSVAMPDAIFLRRWFDESLGLLSATWESLVFVVSMIGYLRVVGLPFCASTHVHFATNCYMGTLCRSYADPRTEQEYSTDTLTDVMRARYRHSAEMAQMIGCSLCGNSPTKLLRNLLDFCKLCVTLSYFAS